MTQVGYPRNTGTYTYVHRELCHGVRRRCGGERCRGRRRGYFHLDRRVQCLMAFSATRAVGTCSGNIRQRRFVLETGARLKRSIVSGIGFQQKRWTHRAYGYGWNVRISEPPFRPGESIFHECQGLQSSLEYVNFQVPLEPEVLTHEGEHDCSSVSRPSDDPVSR